MSQPLHVLDCGAVTAVGLTAAQTCAASRAGLVGFREVYYLPPPERPIIGAAVPASSDLKGSHADWLVNLAVRAANECLQRQAGPGRTALIVNLPEQFRAHPAFDKISSQDLVAKMQQRLGYRFAAVECLREGHAGAFQALIRSRDILCSGAAQFCCVGGIDSLLNGTDIGRLLKSHRLHKADNPWGLIPGEAAAFLLISLGTEGKKGMAKIRGIGISKEDDTILGPKFSQGLGLQRALKGALDDAGVEESLIVFRISDAIGERYRALEGIMAETRFYRSWREHFTCWYPGHSVGDTTAASGFLTILAGCIGMVKGYAPGSIAMCDGSSEAGLRGACVIERSELLAHGLPT
jgi:3-oxoacyl-[acyl-carrier-protein] synthase-1